jgi:hypothetical protein
MESISLIVPDWGLPPGVVGEMRMLRQLPQPARNVQDHPNENDVEHQQSSRDRVLQRHHACSTDVVGCEG